MAEIIQCTDLLLICQIWKGNSIIDEGQLKGDILLQIPKLFLAVSEGKENWIDSDSWIFEDLHRTAVDMKRRNSS